MPINDLARWKVGELDQVLAEIAKVCVSGTFMRGRETRSFESGLATFLGVDNVVTVANGTDALTLALLGLHIEPDDVVITAANAGGYASIAAMRIGAIPQPIDIDFRTGQMDPKALRVSLGNNGRIKAVVLTHLYGYVGDVEEIANICRQSSIPLIEDCAQAIGAQVNGRSVGSFGSIGTFSFYPTKNLGALGDGGALSIGDDHLADRVRRLAQYGWSDRYLVEIPNGCNSRLDEIQAAVLNLRIQTVDSENARRREIALRYGLALPGNRFMIAQNSPAYVAHLAVMNTPTVAEDRARLEQLGIGTAIHYPVIDTDQPAWQGHLIDSPCPNAKRFAESIITLPCFPTMTDEEVDYVCQGLYSLSR